LFFADRRCGRSLPIAAAYVCFHVACCRWHTKTLVSLPIAHRIASHRSGMVPHMENPQQCCAFLDPHCPRVHVSTTVAAASSTEKRITYCIAVSSTLQQLHVQCMSVLRANMLHSIIQDPTELALWQEYICVVLWSLGFAST
jgi:hypothetical protein